MHCFCMMVWDLQGVQVVMTSGGCMRFYTLPILLLCLRRVFTGYAMTHREHDCRTTTCKIAPPARVFCWTGSSFPRASPWTDQSKTAVAPL
ncbi:hypothetical protein M405DRAFT_298773 [Rhizopogon salebrosus TDB-379]|nr:hypothetical protein M405DRAFT_298773 [Rhizopogon salebrosus TDB-379]